MATREQQLEQDIKDLHGLGYAQELFRTMGGFSNFAISFSIISILTGAVILYDYGLAWAGTAAVMIGWPLITLFVLAIAASMAELASAYPTAGGLYYWASKMKNKHWGWWTAWLNLIGQFAIVAGINYAAAGFINATIVDKVLGGTFNTVLVGPINGQLITMGVILAIQLALNVAGINLVALLNQVSVWWHIAIVAVVVILIFLAGKPDQSGLSLFQIQPLDQAGSWNNNLGFVNLQYGPATSYPLVLAFFFSLLLANWTYTGYDASAHVAEETVGARMSSAWGVFLSVAVSAVVGYIFLVALTTHLPDLKTLFPPVLDATTTPTASQYYFGGGVAVISILVYNLGSVLGDLLAAGIAVAMWFCGLSSLAAAGRDPRLRLAEAGLDAVSDPCKRTARGGGRGLAVHRRSVHRRDGDRDRDHHGDQHDLPVCGVWRRHLSRSHDERMEVAPGVEPRQVVEARRLRGRLLGPRPDGPVQLPDVGQHLVAVHGRHDRAPAGLLLRLGARALRGTEGAGRRRGAHGAGARVPARGERAEVARAQAVSVASRPDRTTEGRADRRPSDPPHRRDPMPLARSTRCRISTTRPLIPGSRSSRRWSATGGSTP
jgi:amino acid transporter